MKIIQSVFRDDRDKVAAVAVTLLSLFFSFIPGLIVILFLKEKISENTYELSKALLNLELLFFIITLFFAIPVVGWLLAVVAGPIICIINAVIVILALCSIAKGAEIKIPVLYEFI